MSDLTQATRELFVRTVKNQVWMAMPVYEEMARRNTITFRGGKYIERLIDVAEMDDLAQAYTQNEVLTDQAKDMLNKPRFTWKMFQIPLRYGSDWEIQNANAGNEEQLLDLPQYLVKKGQRAAKIQMKKYLYNNGATTGVADGSQNFQSLLSALDHDITYGTLSRSFSAGTNDWWQGADPAALVENVSSSAQGTSYNISKANMRKWINESDISTYAEEDTSLYVVMSPQLWDKFAAEMEAGLRYEAVPSELARQGIRKMIFDGHQIVSDPYLGTTSTMRTWLFILNLNDWELRISTARNFKMTEFEWQGKNTNGVDYYLARILVAGNLVCWKPKGNMWLSNVS